MGTRTDSELVAACAAARGEPFDQAQGEPFGAAQGEPFDKAQGEAAFAELVSRKEC